MADQGGHNGKPSGEKAAEYAMHKNEDSSEAISAQDEHELARWGKRQQLKRNFGLLSIMSLTCTLMITWEAVLVVCAGPLINGGRAGFIYGFIFVWIGNVLQTLVMAEMGSMMPIAGGQYNWVAILAPPRYAKFLSYITGWITMISWQSVLASAAFLTGTMIQGLLALVYPDNYVFQRWHGTLFFYAILTLALVINTLLVRVLPHVEGMVFIVHILGFFCILIPLVYFAPHVTAEEVFANFANGGGWPTNTLSFFVGITSSVFAFIGLDAAGHMAEELNTASKVIPRSMILSVMVNGTLGLAMVIALLFCLSDVDAALESETGFPYLWIFQDALKSLNGTIALAVVIIITQVFATVGILATTSRMLWAFSRERGVPLSKYISRIEPRMSLPLYSLAVSCLISMLLALLNIASTAALNALLSLTVAGFYSSYFVSAICLLHKKFTTPTSKIAYGPFTMGRWGTPVIIVSLVFTVIAIFFSFFPATVDPTPVSMNWSILVFGASVLFSLGYWVVWGRKVYTGPIVEITLRDLGMLPPKR